MYLLGSCMGALLHQKKILPMHGSGINLAGNGLLLTGRSGAGKSTVAAAFFRQGCRILADDVLPVRLDETGFPIAFPGYPHNKLCRDAVERMAENTRLGSVQSISKNRDKFSVAYIDSFQTEPVPLKIICDLVPEEVKELQRKEITGVEKIHVIHRNTYRRFMTQGLKTAQWHFEQCARIAEKVRVLRIERPKYGHQENEIAALILPEFFKPREGASKPWTGTDERRNP